MKAKEFLSVYTADSLVQTLAEQIRTSETSAIHLKGLSGSLDATVVAAVSTILSINHLVVLSNKEEATSFLSDLQNLLAEKSILFFPPSYKKAYEYEKIENANVCMRLDTMHQLSKNPKQQIIITYPEALGEKVVSKRSLITNTLVVKQGSRLDSKKLEEFLYQHNFERVDFVHEAGQFAVRGGITDIFSFANEYPYRIERFENHVESIRSFDPDSQFSIDTLDGVSIVPNIQTRLIQEYRQSFFDFIPPSTRIWIKDVELISDFLNKNIKKITDQFDELFQRTNKTKTGLEPKELFECGENFISRLERFTKIEFGHRFYCPVAKTVEMNSSAQMSFNKKFEMLADTLASTSSQGYTNFITAEIPKQLERLQGILEGINSESKFQPLDFSLREGFIDRNTKVNCYTDHQLFERFYQSKGKIVKSKAMTLKSLRRLNPGDFVTHIDYGIGKFTGMVKKNVNGKEQEAIRIVFRDNDVLYASIYALHKITKYSGKEGTPPIISKLGTGEWEIKKAKVKKRVRDIAKELIALYAKRKQAPGYSFSSDGVMQAELESSFIYVDTPDQATATEHVKQDMEAPHPMDRLVCGDVGFGKTEVAIRAAFKAVNEGKQVAILVPTTILALQHYRTFCARFANFPVRIEYISRFKSTKEASRIIKEATAGTIDVIIGTHRLTNKNITFKNLGLLVIDEEQKFGVKTKERLKELKVNVDVLTLTATPIPRTLHFSLMGARDLSIITTPPPNRQAVTTALHTYDEKVIRDAISFELQRRGQVFFVHNRINNIEGIANIIINLVPDARIRVAHGQMDGEQLEKTMTRFINGEYDILVSTNIIESGLDIPNANTVIINQAHTFGLSDLHQIRGRVGRSNKKAFCYLLTPPNATLSSDSRKRLSTLEEFSNLGDGLKVAMRDLEIRGAGNILGAEQTGFINDLGFDAYHSILDDAIQELKGGEFKELFAHELKEQKNQVVKECIMEMDLEILIPSTYVKNTGERLHLYTDLNRITGKNELDDFRDRLIDRFGPAPEPVLQLIDSMQLRWMGKKIGIEKMALKSEKLKIYLFKEKGEHFKSEVVGRLLHFVQKNPRRCQFKDKGTKYILEVHSVRTVDEALTVLCAIQKGMEKMSKNPITRE